MNSNRVSVFKVVPRQRRRGLSIMEVLFAIGVLTIGLMGVAFILPVATNNASSALRDDRVVEEINNRVATDLANIDQAVPNLVAAENSGVTPPFFNPPQPLPPLPPIPTDLGFDVTKQRYFDVPFESLPRAFVLDPWFLSSANNLRFNTSASDTNAYDRTLFPCYDRNFVPFLSPSAPIGGGAGTSQSVQWTWPASFGGGRSVLWNTPRFVRMALPASWRNTIPGLAISRATVTSDDDLSIVTSDDSSRGAGLFLQRSGNPMRSLSRSNVTGRFSSMVMMSRSANGSNLFSAAVVTFQDRRLVTVPGGGILPSGDDLKHQLKPYAAAGPNQSLPRDEELTYPGEVMGFVTNASKPFVGGGGGEFVFRTSAFTKPEVKEGGWVCLMRQEYPEDPLRFSVNPFETNHRGFLLTPTGRLPTFDSNPSGPLKFGWFRITDVAVEPTLDATGTFFQTQLKVRGPDWLFHPSQNRIVAASGLGVIHPPYRQGVIPAGAPPQYDFDVTGHPDFGTIVVVMPDVVSVHQFPFQFK